MDELKNACPATAILFIKVPSMHNINNHDRNIIPSPTRSHVPREINKNHSGGTNSGGHDHCTEQIKDHLTCIGPDLCNNKYFSHNVSLNKSKDYVPNLNLFEQLVDLEFMSYVPSRRGTHRLLSNGDSYNVESDLIEEITNFNQIAVFAHFVLQSFLVHAANVLNVAHNRCLQTFILRAFDMTRDILITPRRLEFAREKEDELYCTLIDVAKRKQLEIKDLIMNTISSLEAELLEKAAAYEFVGMQASFSIKSL